MFTLSKPISRTRLPRDDFLISDLCFYGCAWCRLQTWYAVFSHIWRKICWGASLMKGCSTWRVCSLWHSGNPHAVQSHQSSWTTLSTRFSCAQSRSSWSFDSLLKAIFRPGLPRSRRRFVESAPCFGTSRLGYVAPTSQPHVQCRSRWNRECAGSLRRFWSLASQPCQPWYPPAVVRTCIRPLTPSETLSSSVPSQDTNSRSLPQFRQSHRPCEGYRHA